DAELVTDYQRQAARPGPRYAEVLLAHADSEDAALALVHERFRFGALGWAVQSVVPTVEGFEAASQYVRPEDLKDAAGLGPHPERHLAAIRKYLDAGFDHLVLLAVGPDQ